MRHIHDIMRKRLLTKAGVVKPEVRELPSLRILKESEWSPEFEQCMRNRLIMGAFRYELFNIKRQGLKYDLAPEAIRRIKLFIETGNTEHLVDAANMCLIEFEFSNHPNKHFYRVDDGEHAERVD